MKRRNVVPFAPVIVAILAILGISACTQPESENKIKVREVWVEAPNGNKLYSHIHEPANASAENKYPGLALVPGGSGPGTVFDNGQAGDVAKKSFRGLSRWSGSSHFNKSAK